MRIVCIIPTMRGGGAERVLSRLASHWAGAGHEVVLLTLEPAGGTSFYPLPPTVVYRPLSLAGANRNWSDKLQGNWRVVRELRRIFRDLGPAVIVSFCVEMNVRVLAATLGSALPVIVSERADPMLYPQSRIWRIGRRLLYRGARAVVVQTEEADAFFHDWRKVRTWVIPNPVPEALDATGAKREKTVLAVGRLEPQKGFDLLLRAFAVVRAANPGWKLRIVGEGRERAALEAMAASLGLGDAVELLGQLTDVRGEYAAASIFVLSSRFEGFPNVLCEAMAAGLPVVACACRGGVRDIVESERTGLLVPVGETDAMAGAIARLMVDDALRLQLARAARLSIRRYAPEQVFAQWDSCLSEAVQA